jgi:heme oxygenase
LADALGCLYVLEGATLGGQLIGRQVQRQLGLRSEHGCAFFAGYGADQTGPMWKAFSEAVDAYGSAQPAAQGAIVAAACDTFLRFEHWIAV